MPVNIDDPVAAANAGMTEATLALQFDPAVLSVSAADVRLGTVPASGTGWTLQVVVNPATGELGITLFSNVPITDPAGGSLVTINFHVNGTASPGATAIDLVSAVNPTGFNVIATTVADTQGLFTLTPGPTGGAESANEVVTVLCAGAGASDRARIGRVGRRAAARTGASGGGGRGSGAAVTAAGSAGRRRSRRGSAHADSTNDPGRNRPDRGAAPAFQRLHLWPAPEEIELVDDDGIAAPAADPLPAVLAPMTDGHPLSAVVDTPAASSAVEKPLAAESAPNPPAAENTGASATTANTTDQGEDSAFTPTFAAMRSKNRAPQPASPANVFALDEYFARIAEELEQRDAP